MHADAACAATSAVAGDDVADAVVLGAVPASAEVESAVAAGNIVQMLLL